jgi:hypothetical protein
MQNPPHHRPPSIPPEALQALQQGNFILAIKVTRQVTGLGLKESKDLLQDYLDKNPNVQRQIQGSIAIKSRGLMVLGVMLSVLAAIVYFFMF